MANPDQADADIDGVGDASCIDPDTDGYGMGYPAETYLARAENDCGSNMGADSAGPPHRPTVPLKRGQSPFPGTGYLLNSTTPLSCGVVVKRAAIVAAASVHVQFLGREQQWACAGSGRLAPADERKGGHGIENGVC